MQNCNISYPFFPDHGHECLALFVSKAPTNFKLPNHRDLISIRDVLKIVIYKPACSKLFFQHILCFSKSLMKSAITFGRFSKPIYKATSTQRVMLFIVSSFHVIRGTLTWQTSNIIHSILLF